jgi:two-component sensor histidine kinase
MQVVRSVRAALYATALLFALTLVLIRGLALWLEYDAALERAESTTRDMTLILEQFAKRTFETSDHVLREVARFSNERGGAMALRESDEAHRYLVDLSRESSSGDFFLIVDRNGVPSALTAQYPAPDISLRDQDWFQAHLGGADRVVGQAIVGRITGEILFTYTHRMADANGAFDGAVQVAIRPTFFQQLTRSAEPERDAIGREVILGMWTRDGHVIARTGLTPEEITQHVETSPLFAELLAAPSGTFRDVALSGGTEQIVSFRRLDRWPVVVTASIPLSTVLGPWWQSLFWNIAGLVIACAGLAWLTITGARLASADERTQQELRRLNTDLNQALNDKVTLLKEIHHRVKNNLAITSSLLHLQARRLNDPEARAAFRDTEDRLRSVALIHEALYQADASGTVRLDDYLRRLASEVAFAHGAAERAISVVVEADPVEVPLSQAVPMALTVTEALTNAFKHAFPDGSGGRITVGARLCDDHMEITVRDTGRGLPANLDAAPRKGSMGSRLIETFAAQIGATTSYEQDRGTVFRMLVPRAAGI